MKSFCIIFQTILVIYLNYHACAYLLNNSFIPFGLQYGDKIITVHRNDFESEIDIPIQFPFFDRSFSKLYLFSDKAVIAFERTVYNWPLEVPVLNKTCLAPFLSQINLRRAGIMYYREINENKIRNVVDGEINKAFPTLSNYRSLWAFVVTWYKVETEWIGVYLSSIHNTFQAVLTTNGKYSFTIFNYGPLNWCSPNYRRDVCLAGYNAGNGKDYFIIPGSYNDLAYRNISENSNVNINGKWIFRIDSSNRSDTVCRDSGFLNTLPRSIYFVGVEDLIVSGPCFRKDDTVILIYNEVKQVLCHVIDISSCVCKTAYFERIGEVPIKLKINNNRVIEGYINVKNIESKEREKEFENIGYIYFYKDLNSKNLLTWNDIEFENGDEYSVNLITFIESENNPEIITLATNIVNNTVLVDFSLLNPFFDEFLKYYKTGIVTTYLTIVKIKQSPFIISKIIKIQQIDILIHDKELNMSTDNLCKDWHSSQAYLNPNQILQNLPPCWRTLSLWAGRFPMAFLGFVQDSSCNSRNLKLCENHKRAGNVCYTSITQFNQSAQQCCYDNNGRLLVGPSGGGTLKLISPNVAPVNHFFTDIYPYYLCCYLSNNCGLYYDRRPSDDSSRWEAPRPGGASGDPHFLTLDEVAFSFNGFGEYVLLSIKEIDLMIQVRMLPYKSKKFDLQATGTVFKALAISGNKGQDSVQIDLNQFNFIDLFINKKLYDYSTINAITLNGCGIFIEKTSFKILYSIGVEIDVKLNDENDAFLIMISVDSKYKSKTRGLLGVMDYDRTNEFTLPNGTVLPLDPANDKDIFYKYGQFWRTTPSMSIFTYLDGYNHSDYNDQSYVPLFASDGIAFKNKTLETLAKDLCANNLQCLFDASATGQLSVGKLNIDFIEVIKLSKEAIKLANTECVPKSTFLQNGSVFSNITANGERTYEYRCNKDYCLKGNSMIKCFSGIYDSDTPICLKCNASFIYNPFNHFLLIFILILLNYLSRTIFA